MNTCIAAYESGMAEPNTALGQLYRMASALEAAQGECARLLMAIRDGERNQALDAAQAMADAVGTERWTLLGMAIAADLVGGSVLRDVA